VAIKLHASGECGVLNTIHHYYDAHDDVLFLQVLECKHGLSEHLNSLTQQHQSSPNLTELVFLDLCSSSAIYGYESLIDSGYKFCGFDPLGSFEHAVFFKGNIHSAKPEMTGRLASFFTEIDSLE